MSASLFLLATLWTLLGVCAALGVLCEAQIATGRDLRRAGLVLLIALAGMFMRGQTWAWAGWIPMAIAAALTYRLVLSCSAVARTARLGRPEGAGR